MSSPGFGGNDYSAPQTRALSAITNSPNPSADDFASQEKVAALLQRHDYQIKALASGQQQLQQGVNDATQNPIQQIQQLLADFIVLLGGGQLADGALDFGALQYILPTLGALFGLGDGPFPIDLFQAAERFFLGYVVPTKQFTDVINTMIGAWMQVFGIDPKFIKDTKALITAVGQLFGEVGNLLPSLNTFFGAMGMANGAADLGPLGMVLGPIVKLFSGINLADFGNVIEFITAAIDPWIVKLTKVIDFTNEVLAVLGSGVDVVNDPLPQLIVPWQNLMRFLGNVQLTVESFNPVAAAQSWLGSLLLPISGFSTVQPNLQVDPGFDDSNDIGDAGDGKNWTRENLDPPVTDGDWIWDLVGNTASGSATVHANGVDHGLLGTVVYVEEGQTFDFDAYVSWSGLTASTGAIGLHIKTDDGTNTLIASVTAPDTTGDWTHLSGSYTVPAAVTSIRLRLFVGSGATAGQVWFDDTNIRRTNLIHQGLIQDLEDDLATLSGFFSSLLTAAGAGDVAELGSAIAGAVSNAAAALSKIGDMLTAAVVSTPAELGAAIVAAANAAGSAGTQIQSIINNSEAADAGAVGTAILTAVTNAGSALSQLGALITNSAEADAGALGSALAGAISSAQSAINQLGDIITNSTQADAAAVGAALAGAATNAANAIGQVADIVNNAGAADAAAVGSALATASSDASSAVGQLQDAATNALGGAAAAATDFGEALSSGITAWFNAWTGSSAAQASATDIASAAATQASATQASATSIADLQASLAGVYGSGVGGLKAVESFSGDTLPADFTSVGATLAAHTAKYNVGSAQGDAQTVTGIWSSPPPSGGYYYLILRANASLTTYVYLKIGSDGSAELGCVVAGIKTVLDTAAPALGSGGLSFRANSPYTLSVDAAYIFNFSFYQANAPGEASYSDSSHVSQLGSSYRTGAFGTDETSLPGSIAAWDFFDTESFGPAAAYVATSESTNSTTYTDLTTTTDQVTVNVGSSGMVIVFLSAHMTNSASNQAYMGFALSGANTGAASDSYCVSAQPYPGGQPYTIGVPYLLTGLSPGATTFKAKYRVQGYTGTFDSRHIAVIPL